MKTPIFFNNPISGNRGLILRRLIQLRLAVLASVCLGLIYSYFYLQLSLNYSLLISTIVVTLVWSLWLLFHQVTEMHLRDWHLFRELIIDSIFLLIIVFLSGRSANPFIYYFLVLIAISATIFNSYISWCMSASIIIIYTLMVFFDINDHFQHMSGDYRLHLLGMWINFVGSALVINYFISQLAFVIRDYQFRLSAAREETLKSEQIISLGTLATSTVHALGTPLSTLTILLSERLVTTNDNNDKEEIQLMLSQIERCKKTMGKLSLLAETETNNDTSEENHQLESIDILIDDLKEHYDLINPTISPQFFIENKRVQVLITYSLVLRYALINLIDNAIMLS